MVFPKETLINNSPKNISSKCTLKQFLFKILLFGNIYIRNTCKRESLLGYKEKESVLIVFFIYYYVLYNNKRFLSRDHLK